MRKDAKPTAGREWLVMFLVLAVAAITAAGLSTTLLGARDRAEPSDAPTIAWGRAIGHDDRGPCTGCHRVVLPSGPPVPRISALSAMPHAFRGVCENCHGIDPGPPVVPVAPAVPAPPGGGSRPAMAYATLGLMVVLAVWRPRLGARGPRFTPGTAALTGVAVLFLAGLLTFSDLVTSALIQWRALVALTSIMILTGVVQDVGVFDRIAQRIEDHARRRRAEAPFTLVFAVSVVTAALLNNDSAILLLTPLVVALTRRLYPGRPEMTVAFAFAVFLAPGVAPFVISNPMNMIVAEIAGIPFNDYARVMAPISLAGAALTFVLLRRHFRRLLTTVASRRIRVSVLRPHRAEGPAVALLLTVFAAYPVVAAFGGPVWAVSLTGALAAIVLAREYGVTSAREVVRHVSPDILMFLWGVFLVVVGLRHAGAADALMGIYRIAPAGGLLELGVIGTVSALGSALVDNHPMSLLNLTALGGRGDTRPLLAALIGGDIGPRLLPIGSLAGLLWIDLLRRSGVEVTARRFARVGTLVLLPTLTLSLVMLWLLVGR